MTKSTPRQTWIDCVRGIGIFLVVLGHYDQGANWLCKWIASFHMPLFFILSGILIAIHEGYSNQSLSSILIHKAKKLFYPYFTFSLLVILYYLLRGRFDSISKIIFYTATLEGHNTLWFLPSLWMAECLLLLLLRSKLPLSLCTAAMIIGTSAYAALQYYVIGGSVPADEGLHYQILNGLCRAGIGFVFIALGYQGYLLRSKFSRFKKSHLRFGSLAIFALGYCFGALNGMADMHYSVQHNPLLYYLAAWLQSVGLITFCAVTVQKNAVLEFFGHNSLIIMATHYPLPVILLAQHIMSGINTGMRYFDALIGSAIVMMLEVIVILLINRCFPYLLRIPSIKRRKNTI